MTDMTPTAGATACADGTASEAVVRPRFDYAIRAQLLVLAGHDPKLTRTALAVLANLVGRAGPEGIAWPSHGRIARDTKITRRTVVREIGRLRSLGWIRLSAGAPGRAARYELGQMGPHQRSLVTGLDPGLIRVTCDTQVPGGVTSTSQGGVTSTSHRTKGSRTKGGNLAPLAPPPPLQDAVIRGWNELLPNNPPVRVWTEKRGMALEARALEDPARLNPSWWLELFAYVGQCPLLVGRVPGSDGRRPWRASLDWLLDADHLARVIEGQFDDEVAA